MIGGRGDFNMITKGHNPMNGTVRRSGSFWVALIALISFHLFLDVHRSESGEKAKPMAISAGKEISIEYTLKLDDKTTVDGNVGGEPLKYVQGEHQLIPGLENALEGLKIGDTKHVVLKPEDGYGAVDPNAFMEVQKSQVPQDGLKVGAPLQGRDPSGRPIHARVSEIKESTVVLDFNHPLAGKTLVFDVKILGIQAQAKAEAKAPSKPGEKAAATTEEKAPSK